MPPGTARDSFYEAGLEILADLGFGALKLAEVCQRLGVTTGSFYHYFDNWSAYTRELVTYWREERTVRFIDALRRETDPRRRIRATIEVALALPHGAESAIRSWSSVDPEVHKVQQEVDRQRFDVIYEAALEICGDPRQAHTYAAMSVYVFVGYEQATLPREGAIFEWIATRMLEDLQASRFVDVPPPP